MGDNYLMIGRNANKRWKYLGLIDYLLPAYVILSLPLFYLGVNYAFLFKGITVLAVVFYLLRCGVPKTKTTNLFTVFFLVVAFSIIQYLYNERPIACYFIDASNYLLAMLFFFVGASDDRPGRPFYNKMAFVIAVVFFVGLLCYVMTPSWYVSRNLELLNARSFYDYSEDSMLEHMRFGAFFGDSYYVSHLSVFCSAISIFGIAYTEGRNKLFFFVCLFIGIVSSIACMHRASIIGSFIAIILFMYFNHKTSRYKDNFTIVFVSILVIVAFIYFTPSIRDRLEDIIGMITNRVDDNMNLNKALDERKNTKELLSSMNFFVFGHGLGAGGVQVREYGFPGIADMQYVKMFFENGIVGALLFLGLFTRIMIRGIKYIKFYLTEVIIILFIFVAMLGSNSLSIYYVMVVPFWYAAGRVCNDDYLKRLKHKEWM